MTTLTDRLLALIIDGYQDQGGESIDLCRICGATEYTNDPKGLIHFDECTALKIVALATEAAAEITRLTSEVSRLDELSKFYMRQSEGRANENVKYQIRLHYADALAEAMQEIKQWAEAYPKDVFPAPNLKLADRILKDAGISMTGMNGTFARHLMKGVGKIADAALTAFKEGN